MPKYVLDDKGILTITSEHDGGIFTVNDVLKKLTSFLLVVSIVFSIGIYIFFYHDAYTSNFAIRYSVASFSEFSPSYQLTRIAENSDLGYGFKQIYSKMKKYPAYYEQSFEMMVDRGQELISEINYQIDSFRHRWR